MIDWTSDETHIILNPRMPERDAYRIKECLKRFLLPSHIWLTTSGTSGKFKCVALSKEAFLYSAESVNRFLDITDADIWINPLPDFHVGGLGIQARTHISGAQSHQLPRWEPKGFTEMVHQNSATLSALVPTQMYDLVKHKLSPPQTYRFTLVGGGAMDRSLFERSWDLGWNAVCTYGMTECASQVATAKPGSYDQLQPLDHVSVITNEKQQILIKSKSLLTGCCYPLSPDMEFIDPRVEGWLTTEDRGILKNDFLKILGRERELIKIKGELVNLQELQKIICEFSYDLKISGEAVLTAVPCKRSGYEIHLVHTDCRENMQNLIDHYNLSVLPYEKIAFSHRLESIPRTPIGKVVQNELINIILNEI